MEHKCTSKPSSLQTLILSTILLFISPTAAMPGPDYGGHPRFICIPVPADTDPACFPSGGPVMGPSGAGHHMPPVGPPNNNGWWGMTEEAKTTILHLRESLVQQKETILDMRETIRELTAKLTLCEGSGPGIVAHNDHHEPPSHHGGAVSHLPYADNGHHGNQQGHHGNNNHALDAAGHYPWNGGHHSDSGHNNRGKDKHATPEDMISSKSPEELGRMLQALKERMDNLQSRNTSTTYSSSLKELLQRKISALEQQMHHTAAALSSSPNHHDDSDHHDDGHHEDHDDDGHHEDHDDDGHHDDSHHDNHHDNDGHHDDSHHDDHPDDHHDDGQHDNEADSHGYLQRTGYRIPGPRAGLHSNNKLDSLLNNLHHTGTKNPDAFQIGFPMRTNYMYGKVKMTLLHEIFALTLCLWIKGGAGPGLGTPFSYSVPGQANELVLIEWGNNPMELLVDDKAVTLPLSISDGKWHHVCVTWSTRDGEWEAYQDGVKRGSGENLSAWHPIKPGGVFILGQEQDTLGGRFDATQAFMGDISDLQMWANVLTAHDIYSLASCNSHLSGDVITWSENVVELHGGVTKYPFDPCH